jgi:hypothetical protein
MWCSPTGPGVVGQFRPGQPAASAPTRFPAQIARSLRPKCEVSGARDLPFLVAREVREVYPHSPADEAADIRPPGRRRDRDRGRSHFLRGGDLRLGCRSLRRPCSEVPAPCGRTDSGCRSCMSAPVGLASQPNVVYAPLQRIRCLIASSPVLTRSSLRWAPCSKRLPQRYDPPMADLNRMAHRVVQQATEPEPEDPATPNGRSGGLKGGKARAEKLSPAKRSEIARKAAQARWGKNHAASS